MIKAIGVEDYMSVNPLTFSEDTDLFDAIHSLLERKVTGATVIDSDNKVVGVISELDCLKAIIDGAYYGDVGGKVGQFMTRQVQSLDNVRDMDILAIAKIMIDGNRRRFPIVKDGKFVGQVSARSILQAVKDFVATHDPSEDSPFE